MHFFQCELKNDAFNYPPLFHVTDICESLDAKKAKENNLSFFFSPVLINFN